MPSRTGEHRHDDGTVEQNLWVGAPTNTDQMMSEKYIAQITGTLDEIAIYTYTGNGTDGFESIMICPELDGKADLANPLATFTGTEIENIPTTHTWITLTPASTISLNSGDVFYLVAQWPDGNTAGPYMACDLNNSGYGFWTGDAGVSWNAWTGEFFMRAYMTPPARNMSELITSAQVEESNTANSSVYDKYIKKSISAQAQDLYRIDNNRETFANYTVSRGTTTGVYTELATGISSESYSDDTVVNDTEYFYVVQAVYNEGTSVYSNEASAIPSGNPPNEVAFIAPADGATAQLVLPTFSWNADATATGYKLQYGVATGVYDTTIDCGNVTSYTLTTALAYNTEYFWRVVPYNVKGDATVTNEWNFTTFDGVPTNPTPADDATNVANNVTLDWSDVNGALGYLITIGTTSGGNDIANAVSCATSEYTHTSVWDYEQEYFWTVTTVDAQGREVVVNNVSRIDNTRRISSSNRNVTGNEWSFTVMADPTIYSFPWVEEFSSWPPQNWDLTGGTVSWVSYNNSSAEASFWGWPGGNYAFLTTPPLEISTLSNPVLTFDWSHLYSSTYPDKRILFFNRSTKAKFIKPVHEKITFNKSKYIL